MPLSVTSQIHIFSILGNECTCAGKEAEAAPPHQASVEGSIANNVSRKYHRNIDNIHRA